MLRNGKEANVAEVMSTKGNGCEAGRQLTGRLRGGVNMRPDWIGLPIWWSGLWIFIE
jgi:hypothetical protein